MSVWRLYHDSRGKVVLKTKRQKILWFPYSKNYKAKSCKGKVRKVGVVKNFANFTGKHLFWSLFLIKLQALLKRDSNTGVFLWNLQKFLRTPILQNTSGGSFLAYPASIWFEY